MRIVTLTITNDTDREEKHCWSQFQNNFFPTDTDTEV